MRPHKRSDANLKRLTQVESANANPNVVRVPLCLCGESFVVNAYTKPKWQSAVSSEKPISTPRFLRRLQLVGGIVAHSDFVLPNGDEKRHSEAAIETATRRGNEKRPNAGRDEGAASQD